MSDPQPGTIIPAGNILDREYDGIQEYDNPLPGWWVGLFWLCIVFSGLYWMYYEWGAGPSVHDEYDNAALAYYEKQATLYGEMEINNETIGASLGNPDALKNARTLYLKHCQSCHADSGGGDIGPNLTDEYWLRGGELEDIYETISEGVPGAGMQAWKNKLNPLFIMWLSAYVRSLQGTSPPNAKAPQGQKFVPPVLNRDAGVSSPTPPEKSDR